MTYGLPDCIRFALSASIIIPLYVLTALLLSHHWPEALALLLIWIACEIFTYHAKRRKSPRHRVSRDIDNYRAENLKETP